MTNGRGSTMEMELALKIKLRIYVIEGGKHWKIYTRYGIIFYMNIKSQR